MVQLVNVTWFDLVSLTVTSRFEAKQRGGQGVVGDFGFEVRIWITSQYGRVICECGDDGVMSGGDIGCKKVV